MFDPRRHDQHENCQEAACKLESFGINVCDHELAGNQEQKIVNLNAITDDMAKKIASNIQALLLEIQGNENSAGNDHIYSTNDKLKDKTENLSVLYNAVCLWRMYLQLKDTFGKKVIDYKQMGINTKNACLDSSCTYNDEEGHAGGLDNELQRLANTWGYDVVNIAGDGNCFFTAVAFQLNQIMTTTNAENVPGTALRHLISIGITPEQTVPDIANTLRRLVVDEWTGQHMDEYQHFLLILILKQKPRTFSEMVIFQVVWGCNAPWNG
jgi:hypothetical protein